MQDFNIGFIGGGHMTSSLMSGLIKSGFSAKKLFVYDRNSEKTQLLHKQLGIIAEQNLEEIVKRAQVLVLAVKPQDMKALVETLGADIAQQKPLLISIAAGISTRLLEKWLGEHHAIIRAMPNTPALLKVGATGLYANSKTLDSQKELAESILRAVGITVWVNHEHDIDTITAISGSGPAYFFLMMEALQQGAEKLGLPKASAKILILQTALGAARMAMESDISLRALIEKVASPGGTTEKALSVLEAGGIQELLIKAVEAAKHRSQEISENFKES